VIDLRVEVDIEAAAPVGVPVLEDVEALPGERARRRRAVEQIAHERDGLDRPDVLSRRGVHRRRDLGQVPLVVRADQACEVLVQQVDPHDGAVAAEVVVRGTEAMRHRLVPVGHRPVRGIDPLGMLSRGEVALPLVLAVALRGEAGVRQLVAKWQLARRVLRDVIRIDVERVERLRRFGRCLEEVLVALNRAV
jgi:hypothetical protein